jgi:hypothetical protein
LCNGPSLKHLNRPSSKHLKKKKATEVTCLCTPPGWVAAIAACA